MTYNESQISKYGWPKKIINSQETKKLIQDKKRNDKYLH